MEIVATELPGPVSLVRLSGRLDAVAAEAVGVRFTAATAAQARPAVIDLSEVSFLASMGLRLIIASARALQSRGYKLAVYGATGPVSQTLKDSAVDQIIPVADTQAEAIAAACH